eukprot:5473964-Prymnesium_polylepis.2
MPPKTGKTEMTILTNCDHPALHESRNAQKITETSFSKVRHDKKIGSKVQARVEVWRLLVIIFNIKIEYGNGLASFGPAVVPTIQRHHFIAGLGSAGPSALPAGASRCVRLWRARRPRASASRYSALVELGPGALLGVNALALQQPAVRLRVPVPLRAHTVRVDLTADDAPGRGWTRAQPGLELLGLVRGVLLREHRRVAQRW